MEELNKNMTAVPEAQETEAQEPTRPEKQTILRKIWNGIKKGAKATVKVVKAHPILTTTVIAGTAMVLKSLVSDDEPEAPDIPELEEGTDEVTDEINEVEEIEEIGD